MQHGRGFCSRTGKQRRIPGVHPISVVRYLAFAVGPWVLKIVLYGFAFRKRRIKASSLTVLIVAGASIIVGAVTGMIPVLSGAGFAFIATVGTAIYFCRQYTDGKLYPDVIGIVLIVEIISSIIVGLVSAIVS